MDEKDKQAGQKGPELVGESKGGSQLLKYGGSEFDSPKMGFADQSTSIDPAERERVYEEMFGTIDEVNHEVIPFVPHIDLYRFAPTEKRPFFTFITGGMSDVAMNAPAELGPAFRRVELVFYASEDKPEYLNLLRDLAHFPHDNQTWLHWGHTMPNGMPPAPLLGTSHLDCMLFMESILTPDSTLGERLAWRDEPVNLIWVMPITMAECDFKLERGSDELYDLFSTHQHPFIFAGDRASYV